VRFEFATASRVVFGAGRVEAAPAAAYGLLHGPLPSVRHALIAFAGQASDDPVAAGLQRALESDTPR